MSYQASLIADFLNKPNIVVWGCGQNGKDLLKRFPELAERITEFVDSSFLKIGERFLDRWEIKAPTFPDPNIHNIIVTPYNSKEIVEYLETKGFIYAKNCIFYYDLTGMDNEIITNGIKLYKETHPEICLLTF